MFKINGQEQRLTALGGDPSKGLSFVFNDLTAKIDTYPGGRFLENRCGGEWNGDSGLQPCLQSSVCRDTVCDVSAGAEGEPADGSDSCGEKFDKAAHGHH